MLVFEGSAVTVTRLGDVLTIAAKKNASFVDDDSVEGVIRATTELLDENFEFMCFWNLNKY